MATPSSSAICSLLQLLSFMYRLQQYSCCGWLKCCVKTLLLQTLIVLVRVRVFFKISFMRGNTTSCHVVVPLFASLIICATLYPRYLFFFISTSLILVTQPSVEICHSIVKTIQSRVRCTSLI
ncbi:unnamed protein product [Kuraishia capsulata CBS 1993]|uniref:Uncharacterized protein n=1 Tax=Kuraishia capsulata CBS 1993 TaxID=1382522 RepID=W6MUC3_9ASCO|nr:uncharacterized protein KUCA_T00001500001 [Kuraishia capsulata CBS 1993]CDK25530.1 unnamed protein product [Kuraishia capsulata CBS 1993]